jgi:hypothetical protein
MRRVFAFLVITVLSPFIGVALISSYLAAKRFKPKPVRAAAGGLAAVFAMWVAVFSVVFVFLVLLEGRTGDWDSWLRLVGVVAVFSIPVFALGALVGWHAGPSHLSVNGTAQAPLEHR